MRDRNTRPRRRRIGGLGAGLVAFMLPVAGAQPAPAASAHPGWKAHAAEFCRQVAGDFRRLPSPGNLLGLGIGSGLSLAAHSEDRDVAERMTASNRLQAALEPGKWIGSAAFLVPATLVVHAAGYWRRRPAVERAAAELLRAQVLSQTLTLALKVSVRRSRPDGGGMSFPSSHASASFAVATVLQERCGWKAGLPAFVLSTGVAASRLSERRHWLSDVVFGATLGVVSGRTVMLASGDGRCRLAPVVGTDGAGLALVWRPRSDPR